MIAPVPSVAAMAPYALADLGRAGSVSLAQNESAFGPSPKAIAAGQAALAGAALYPDPDWTELREAIAETLGLDASLLLCGAGSMELIGALIRAFAGPEQEVLGTAHGYLFVATACEQAGACYLRASERDFAVSVDALLAHLSPRTRMLFLCNPGNPTGTRLSNAEIVHLREVLPSHVLLVVDQAYGEFDDQDPAPVFALAGRGDTVVLRSFSKAYAIAGCRVGWGLFPEAIGRETRKLLNPNNIAAVSQAMAAAAMRDQAHMREITAKTATIRDLFSGRLATAGYAIPRSHTNFVLIPFASAEAAREADLRLREEGFTLRALGGYGLHNCLRATIASAEHMDRAADVLVALSGEGHDH